MIPVIYCGNQNTFKGVLLSIISILRRSKETIKFYILTMDLTFLKKTYLPYSDEQIDILNKIVKNLSPESEVIKLDLTEQFKTHFLGGRNVKNSYTPYALLRLLVDDQNIIPFDKAIYLDYDIMAVKDINILWNEDVSEFEYGASLDQLGKFWVNPRYCNSGVLLINLKKCRETGLFEKARKKVYKNIYFMPDQTALFRSVKARLLLPRKYNEQRSIKEDTVIKHFNKFIQWFPFKTVNIKQWDIKRVHNRLKIHDFDEDYKIFNNFNDELHFQDKNIY
jgi:lipopolysaccharide biosynthesis glycosyltransferase